MSFLKELETKKRKLKPCQTIITSFSGNKYLEDKNNSGELEIKKLADTSLGFVVDAKLDLQIAKILDYLYLSSQDPAQDDNLLMQKGITHVVSIGVDLPKIERSSKIKFVKFDLLDEPEANLKKTFNLCFKFIKNVRINNEKNKILLHCNAGYSRAPTIVVGYLMQTFGYSLNEALQIVKKKRNIKPNEGFIKQLEELEKFLNESKFSST